MQQELTAYLSELKIPDEQISQSVDARSGKLKLSLTTPQNETLTLDFFTRPEFSLAMEDVRLPDVKGGFRMVSTVSKKEIVLALLQHGRVTEFIGEACTLNALIDHVGVRQNIVAWAENLNWIWPNGGPAKWNPKYWKRGTPLPGVSLHAAVLDAFVHQSDYAIGCYTATKLVIVHGTLDYYHRVKKDPVRYREIEKILRADGEPLVGIEPGNMWSFEEDFDMVDMERPGKLMNLHANVAPGNFIPGDWTFLQNTDAKTSQKTGYEGSNAIYLGRNRFDDYYNDHRHGYSYEQKINEVYQWRNGVFNRVRDAKKSKPLTSEDIARLSNTPADGGMQMGFRVGPRYF